MAFSPTRLTSIRENLGINKAEAARRLNMTAMGYGRYENSKRLPSFQTIQYIAQIFGTSYEYLCEMTDDPAPNTIVIRKDTDPELFAMAEEIKDPESPARERMLTYYQKIKNE